MLACLLRIEQPYPPQNKSHLGIVSHPLKLESSKQPGCDVAPLRLKSNRTNPLGGGGAPGHLPFVILKKALFGLQDWGKTVSGPTKRPCFVGLSHLATLRHGLPNTPPDHTGLRTQRGEVHIDRGGAGRPCLRGPNGVFRSSPCHQHASAELIRASHAVCRLGCFRARRIPKIIMDQANRTRKQEPKLSKEEASRKAKLAVHLPVRLPPASTLRATGGLGGLGSAANEALKTRRRLAQGVKGSQRASPKLKCGGLLIFDSSDGTRRTEQAAAASGP